MKKLLNVLIAFAMVFSLVSCASVGVVEEAAAEPLCRVTFCEADGVTVLKEVEVAPGTVPADPGLVRDGYMIKGYFATPALLIPYDMTAPVTEDTTVFVAWQSSKVDERPWMIAGSFRAYPENAWGNVWPQDDFRLAPVEGEFNTFSIEMDLFKGDEFKIAVIGEGYAWDSANELNSTAVVKNDYVTGGENAFDTGANIKVVADGRYRLTIKTDAESIPLCKLYVERIGEVEFVPEIVYDMKVWASFNDWAGSDMKQNGSDKIWYAEVDVPEGGGEFGVKNAASGAWYSSENNSKNIVLEGGHYMIFIQLEEKDGVPVLVGDIVAETPAYYVVGTCGNGAWAADANAANEAYRMTEKDGRYVLDVTFTDAETADWAGGKVAFKVVYGAGGRVANEFWYGNGGDNVLVEPGTYTITFDPATGAIEF